MLQYALPCWLQGSFNWKALIPFNKLTFGGLFWAVLTSLPVGADWLICVALLGWNLTVIKLLVKKIKKATACRSFCLLGFSICSPCKGTGAFPPPPRHIARSWCSHTPPPPISRRWLLWQKVGMSKWNPSLENTGFSVSLGRIVCEKERWGERESWNPFARSKDAKGTWPGGSLALPSLQKKTGPRFQKSFCRLHELGHWPWVLNLSRLISQGKDNQDVLPAPIVRPWWFSCDYYQSLHAKQWNGKSC